MLTGGSIVPDLVGIIVGHFYWYLKDVVPIENGIDLLPSPVWLETLCTERLYARPRQAQREETVQREQTEITNSLNQNTSFRAEATATQNTAERFVSRAPSWEEQ